MGRTMGLSSLTNVTPSRIYQLEPKRLDVFMVSAVFSGQTDKKKSTHLSFGSRPSKRLTEPLVLGKCTDLCVESRWA